MDFEHQPIMRTPHLGEGKSEEAKESEYCGNYLRKKLIMSRKCRRKSFGIDTGFLLYQKAC